jgi:hypothetical protein
MTTLENLRADGIAYLCDKCDTNPAKYVVSGLTTLSFYDGLCARCCADWLESKGDLEGARKFRGEV